MRHRNRSCAQEGETVVKEIERHWHENGGAGDSKKLRLRIEERSTNLKGKSSASSFTFI